MRKFIITILGLILSITSYSQEKMSANLEIDKRVHNFGDILMEDGPVSCSFNIKNTGSEPAVIYNVVSSCGCTDVKWTREPIMPGKGGKIAVTYSNDEGAYPFDKTLTVYFSDSKKPFLLKIRGVSHKKKKPLEELYTHRFGPLGIKEAYLKCGNIEQKGMKSDIVNVANLSDRPIYIEFADVSENLSLKLSANPIPAREVATLTFTIKASRGLWGKNDYWATPVVDGKRYNIGSKDEKLGFWAFTRENFNHLSDGEKANGPRPEFKASTHTFGKIKAGETVHAEFELTNKGKQPFCVYKVDVNACKWSHSDIPVAAPGESVKFRVHLDTASLPKGESLTIVSLVTNSPLRPVVNLFITGWIE